MTQTLYLPTEVAEAERRGERVETCSAADVHLQLGGPETSIGGEDRMFGIILTLLAGLFVVCVAFYFSDHPGSHSHFADPLFQPQKRKDHR